MGMPVTVEIINDQAEAAIDDTFEYFEQVDRRFSTYQPDSEISRVNAGLPEADWSDDMKHVLRLCEETKHETEGFFDIEHNGDIDPSGLVKGWAIQQAADRLRQCGVENFYVEAGGDIQVGGRNADGGPWLIGIRNPANRDEVVKVVKLQSEGIATSGTAIRGQHIYDPHHPGAALMGVTSLTVVGPDVYEADRFATAAFAMGPDGIAFIERRPGLEGYMITADGQATLTSGFERYVSRCA